MKSKTLKYHKLNQNQSTRPCFLLFATLLLAIMTPLISCGYTVNQSSIKNSDFVKLNGTKLNLSFGSDQGTWALTRNVKKGDGRLFEFYPKKPKFINFDGQENKGQSYIGESKVLAFYENGGPVIRKRYISSQNIKKYRTKEKLLEFQLFITKKIKENHRLLAQWNKFPIIKLEKKDWKNTGLFKNFQYQIKKNADSNTVEETNRNYFVRIYKRDFKLFIKKTLMNFYIQKNPESKENDR